jgi:hypothetical protein
MTPGSSSNPDPQAQALDAAAADANQNAGSGNVGDPVAPCAGGASSCAALPSSSPSLSSHTSLSASQSSAGSSSQSSAASSSQSSLRSSSQSSSGASSSSAHSSSSSGFSSSSSSRFSSSSSSSGPGAVIQVIIDKDKNQVVDENEPTTKFVRFGLWDQAYDGAGNVQNGAAEASNFIGSDFRRFYFRVHDPFAAGPSVNINWKTLKADGSDDDAPASLVLTLQETRAGSKFFVSKAVMLVTDTTDRDQPTDSGLAAPLPDVGVRNRGQSNHRLRKGAIDGSVKAEYTSARSGLVSVTVPVFNRSPDERRRVSVAVINYNTSATAAYITGQFDHANTHWNRVGIQIDAQATVNRPIPAGALNGAGQYAGSLDNAAEQAALADLIPITADGTLTVVFLPLSGANAYATVGQRTSSALQNRFFIFVNNTLALTDETVAHELHHVLFNRFDIAVARQFYTFNTNPPSAFGVALPDVRIYGRVQNLNSADPDNDAANNNIINWAKRVRTARFPIGAGTSAATATTGNTFAQVFQSSSTSS